MAANSDTRIIILETSTYFSSALHPALSTHKWWMVAMLWWVYYRFGLHVGVCRRSTAGGLYLRPLEFIPVYPQ